MSDTRRLKALAKLPEEYQTIKFFKQLLSGLQKFFRGL